MILRIPLLPETVGKVEDLPAKLKFLAPAVRKLGTSELEDAELAARFPEKDDRDGFLLCRRAFREKVADLTFTANLEPAPGMRGGTGYLTTEETP